MRERGPWMPGWSLVGAATAGELPEPLMIWSMSKPYSSASVAVNHLSRSESSVICSRLLSVCSAISSASVRFIEPISSAWKIHVRGGAAQSTQRLVHQHPRVRGRRSACPWCRRRAGTAPWTRPCPCRSSPRLGLDELHGVVDGHASGNRATGAVDVEETSVVGQDPRPRAGAASSRWRWRHHRAPPTQRHDAFTKQALVDVVVQPHRDSPAALRGGRSERSEGTCVFFTPEFADGCSTQALGEPCTDPVRRRRTGPPTLSATPRHRSSTAPAPLQHPSDVRQLTLLRQVGARSGHEGAGCVKIVPNQRLGSTKPTDLVRGSLLRWSHRHDNGGHPPRQQWPRTVSRTSPAPGPYRKNEPHIMAQNNTHRTPGRAQLPTHQAQLAARGFGVEPRSSAASCSAPPSPVVRPRPPPPRRPLLPPPRCRPLPPPPRSPPLTAGVLRLLAEAPLGLPRRRRPGSAVRAQRPRCEPGRRRRLRPPHPLRGDELPVLQRPPGRWCGRPADPRRPQRRRRLHRWRLGLHLLLELEQLIVDAARSAVGTPYSWGGSSLSGMDCSGLVAYAYGAAGIDVPRTSSQQAAQGRSISQSQAQPGDSVVWPGHSSPTPTPGRDHRRLRLQAGRPRARYLGQPQLRDLPLIRRRGRARPVPAGSRAAGMSVRLSAVGRSCRAPPPRPGSVRPAPTPPGDRRAPRRRGCADQHDRCGEHQELVDQTVLQCLASDVRTDDLHVPARCEPLRPAHRLRDVHVPCGDGGVVGELRGAVGQDVLMPSHAPP